MTPDAAPVSPAAPGLGTAHRASAHLAVVAPAGPGGRMRCEVARCEPPLTFRTTRATSEAAHVVWVGTTAGPIGGDELDLRIDVRDRARLTVTSAGAALVLPGPDGRPSHLTTRIVVGRGGALTWQPEPTVLADGCRHLATTRIDLADDAELVWVDEIVLGRHAAPAGRCTGRLLVDVGGAPLLRTGIDVGAPGWCGPAVVGTARYTAQVLAVGPSAEPLAHVPTTASDGVRAAGSVLGARSAVLRTVVADDVLAGRDEVAAALRVVGA